MKQVKIRILDSSVVAGVRTQAESKGFIFIEYIDNIMVFEKENNQIESIKDLKRIPGLGEYIQILSS